MTAAALIRGPAAMVAPYRIAQIQIARIGGCSDHGAANRASRRAQGRIPDRSTDRGAAGRAQQSATCRSVTRIGTATGKHQGRRKTHYHCRAHIWLPKL